jgi:hypothetical protein
MFDTPPQTSCIPPDAEDRELQEQLANLPFRILKPGYMRNQGPIKLIVNNVNLVNLTFKNFTGWLKRPATTHPTQSHVGLLFLCMFCTFDLSSICSQKRPIGPAQGAQLIGPQNPKDDYNTLYKCFPSFILANMEWIQMKYQASNEQNPSPEQRLVGRWKKEYPQDCQIDCTIQRQVQHSAVSYLCPYPQDDEDSEISQSSSLCPYPNSSYHLRNSSNSGVGSGLTPIMENLTNLSNDNVPMEEPEASTQGNFEQ